MKKKKRKALREAQAAAEQQGNTVPESQAMWSYDAATWSPARNYNFWPLGDPRQPLTDFDLMTIYRRARSLEANNPAVKKVVRTTVQVMGYMTPRATTQDEEWNRLARELFLRKAMNPATFDASGRLNYIQAQEWTEKRAIVDGDVLSVNVTTADGQPRIRFYQAPQLTASAGADGAGDRLGRLRAGVTLGAGGRITSYRVLDFNTNKVFAIPASRAFLYGHSNDPADPRHISELVAVIPTAQDLLEINRLHKGQIKIGATFGLIETKNLADAEPAATGLKNTRLLKRAAGQAGAGQEGATPIPGPVNDPPLFIDGNKVISLAPGRELKTLHNSNPSNEVRAFFGDQLNSVAYGTASGLLHQVAFAPETLGGASARFVLSQTKDLADARNRDRVNMLNSWWQHFIACAIATGELRPCKDPTRMWTPKWTARSAWAIDYSRDINAFIALKGNNLAAASLYTEANYDMTYQELLDMLAAERKAEIETAERHGIPLSALVATPAGAAPQPWLQQEEPAEKTEGTKTE